MKCNLNTRVITVVVSAVSAIVCAVFSGCKFVVGELSLKDAGAEILSTYCTTNGGAR